MRRLICSLVSLALVTSIALGDVIQVELVVHEGMAPPGAPDAPASAVNAPMTNGRGELGCLLTLDADGVDDDAVWIGNDVVWRASDELPLVVGSTEPSVGVSDDGGFAVSSYVEGLGDSIWTQHGLVLAAGDQAPGMPAGTSIVALVWPRMTASGRAYWVSVFDDQGGTVSRGRILYTSPDASASAISVVFKSDDLIDGFVLDRPRGVDRQYDISDNGQHHIHRLFMDTGSTSDDEFLYVDGAMVAREGEANAQGHVWDSFVGSSINDLGYYIADARLDSSHSIDRALVVNGLVEVREGDTIDGVQLASSAVIAALSINNRNQVAHLWYLGTGDQVLFVGNASSLAASSTEIIRAGDHISVDGDHTADFRINDLPVMPENIGLDLDDDGTIFVEAELEPIGGGAAIEAIIRVSIPPAACPADLNLDGGVNVLDLIVLLTAWGDNPGHVADLDHDGTVNALDLLQILADWGSC